jgi:enoyl-CoA hydratase
MSEQVQQSSIQVERSGSIATLVIGRAERGNVLGLADLESLHALLTEVLQDGSIRVLIMTGAGSEAFSNGVDLEAMASLNDSQCEAYVALSNACLGLIDSLSKPVVAAINGRAVGLGCEMALACHLRVAVPNAEFAISELGPGVPPVCGFSPRLAELIGGARALELMLCASSLGAPRALELGVINRVVDSALLLDATKELAGDLAESAPLAMKFALEINRDRSQLGFARALALETKRFSECFSTEDMREGVRAFLEKRKPEFKGR